MSDHTIVSKIPLSEVEQSEYMSCKIDISEGLDKAAAAIENIRDNRLYRDEYSSFEDFCQTELGKPRSYVNRLISSLQVNGKLMLGAGAKVPQRVALELNAVVPEQQAQAFLDVQAQSPSPTAADVHAIVQAGIASGKYTAQRPTTKTRKQKPKLEQTVAEQSQSSKTELLAIPTSTATESGAVPKPVPTPDLSSPLVLKLLTLFDVEVGENAGAWLVAAYSPDEAQTLVATDQLIPFADLKCKLYETEGITIVASGTPHILFGGMWRKVEAPRPAERPMAKPTVNYPPASSPAPRAVGMPERPFFPSPKNLHNERVARKEGAAPERKQARHDEEFES